MLWFQELVGFAAKRWFAATLRFMEMLGFTTMCEVHGNARVYDHARVYDDAEVYGYVRVAGAAWICGDVKVSGCTDYIVFKNWWSSGRYFTWTRSNNMWCVGCFYGTGAALIKKAYADSELSGREYERVVKYVESILAESK